MSIQFESFNDFRLYYILKMDKLESISIYRGSNINPFMPNVFSHPYQLAESIFNFRVVGRDFSFLFIFLKKVL